MNFNISFNFCSQPGSSSQQGSAARTQKTHSCLRSRPRRISSSLARSRGRRRFDARDGTGYGIGSL